MKISASILLLFCGVMIGLELFRQQTRARDTLGTMLDLCLHMSACIRYQRMTPEMIINSFYDTKDILLSECMTHIQNGDDFAVAWKKMLEHPASRILKAEESDIISQMGCNFGLTDSDGETSRLEHICEHLEIMYRNRCEDCSRQGRSYITTGFLVGALVMIFLL